MKWVVAALAWLAPALAVAVPPDSARVLTRIAFGSCNKHTLDQPIWPAVIAADPDLWIWTGDIVYNDTDDPARMRANYDAQKALPGYRALLEHCPVIGVWDDHDYGRNNAGGEFPAKAGSQRALLDFLDEPAESPRRKQAGVYAGYRLGPPDRRVQIILLDTRFQREPPGQTADLLGEAQWRWLEQELRRDARVRIVVSSIQLVSNDHQWERWGRHPTARARLLETLGRADGVIVLSGDRHLAELSRLAPPDFPYPLWDVTSSGLTHSWTTFRVERNRHRVGEVYSGLNFGLITIEWGAKPLRIRLEVRDVGGRPVIVRTVPRDELAGGD